MSNLPTNDCGEPPPSANTYRTFPDNNTVEYRCIDTFVLSSGDLVRHCVNGKYSGATPLCIANCGPPLNSTSASFVTSGTYEGDNVTYTCPQGSYVSSTVTKCSAITGYWEDVDSCAVTYQPIFYQVSLDAASFTARQTTTATADDISRNLSSSISISAGATFIADNAVDTTNQGLSLLTGDCSSTKSEENPKMSIYLGDTYAIYQVAVTLPNDTFVTSIPNLRVSRSSSNYFERYTSTCLRHTTSIPAGSRFLAKCFRSRYPSGAKYIHLEVDYGAEQGMLQICKVEVYAHLLTLVDCGQPPERPFAVITIPPSNTYYQNNIHEVTYDCIEGYTLKSGHGKGYCTSYGTWSVSLACTADENHAYNRPISLSDNNAMDVSSLTDGERSSCSSIQGVKGATFVIDLGKDTEVTDVSITTSDTSALRTLRIEISVWRNGYRVLLCSSNSNAKYGYSTYSYRYTRRIRCYTAPVGRHVSVYIHYDNIATLNVCEIMVYGRAYTDALECLRNTWTVRDYKGHMNVTVAGIPCQRWDSQIPHAHSHTNISYYPDDKLEDAENYCRNPGLKYRPWCYTSDPTVEWQYCPIRTCDHVCLLDGKGSTYRGTMQNPSSGESCIIWSNSHFQKTIGSDRSSTYCRNPVISQSRPWCYTSTDGSQYGLCDIPKECPLSSDVTRGRWFVDADQTIDDLLPSTECLVWNNFFASDGTIRATSYSAYNPTSYMGSFTIEDFCVAGKAFNTSILCYNFTESGTIWKAGILQCVDCGSPPEVNNTNVSISSSHLNGKATYECVTGYKQYSGSSNFTCLSSGLWEVPDIVCEVYCGDPPENDRTEASSTSGFFNETVEYTCKAGYLHISGSATISCQETGAWDELLIRCEVDCGDPSPVDHADMYVNSTWLGQTVNYSCHDGYVHTSGSDQVTCLETGVWDVTDMTCVVDCGDPSPVDHADMYVNATWLGQTVNYACHHGYAHTSGSDQVTCLETGVWDVADMTCEVDCGTPPPVLHAEVTVSGTWENNVAQYTCHVGFLPLGSAFVTCLPNGTWETPSYICEGYKNKLDSVHCSNSVHVLQDNKQGNYTHCPMDGDKLLFNMVMK
ncbi:uncharacterized protein [Haliotis asinina]|uniref:uncharacterized protein n=1 Tax=Haliotis asinina TaxID=109174 RepID=UPI0035321FAF